MENTGDVQRKLLGALPPTITGCTLPRWAGTGGWVSCPKFNLRVCEGHAFLRPCIPKPQLVSVKLGCGAVG